MARAPRLGLIDGSALTYRSYFVFIRNPLINSRGENTSAVYGFANTLFKILREDEPDYLIVAFDTKAPTPRHEKYPEYKSTRAKMPDELAESLPRVHELVDALNLTVIRQDGVEADDVIGTLARQGREAGMDVTIYSGDKDFCQLVGDGVSIMRPKGGGEEVLVGPDGVEEWMGVRPEHIIDLLALMGDSSDNIPGVPGVGKKTAIKLIGEHGGLDDIYAHADDIKGKLGERLRDHRADAELSRELVTIVTDVALEVTLEDARPGEPDADRLAALFQDLEITRFQEFLADEPVPTREVSYRRLTSLDEVDALVAATRAAEIAAVEVFVTAPSAFDAELVGVSVSVADGEAVYIAVGHTGMVNVADDVNLDASEVLARLGPWLADRDAVKATPDGKRLAAMCRQWGIEVDGVDFDLVLAGYLLEPGRTAYGVPELARAEFDETVAPLTEVTGTGRDRRELHEVEADAVTPVACAMADFTLRLRERFAPRLEDLALRPLYDDVEVPLSRVIQRMEHRGVCLEPSVFDEIGADLREQIDRLEVEIHDLAGREFNVNSPTQLRVILFEELGLPVGRKTKSGPSTDSDVLEKLEDKHPLPAKILEYRQAAKLLSTYVDALPRLVRTDTGRLHTSFNQTVAATGRLSSSDPNLQNIPIRTAAGRRIRGGFVAQEGWDLLSADYSQVELRILASISSDPGLIEAFAGGVDVHRHTAAAVFDVPIDDVTSDMRARAKAVNFGVMYGQGPRGLADVLKIPMKEAKQFIESYFERYSAVRAFKEDVLDRARREGFVTTLLDRRRYLPDINADHHQRRAYSERMAVNTVIQGTAADLIKVAMVAIDRRLTTQGLEAAMLLTVHDELVFEAPPGEREALESMVREEMVGALELEVPLVVDAGWGRSWLEAH